MTYWQQFDALSARAELYRIIRDYMHELEVVEVETPVLSLYANTDPQIESLTTQLTHPGKTESNHYFLHTSPEFHMKRLLANGSNSIYQICKVFRDNESGNRHQPEFTMLEWYRLGLNHHGLMEEINILLNKLGLATAQKITHQDCFIEHIGLDPHSCGNRELELKCAEHGFQCTGEERRVMLDFLFSTLACPNLGIEQPVFIYDYPESQAALARIRSGQPNLAERFELFISGMELANGFHELTDPGEQLKRFEDENLYRNQIGMVKLPVDTQLIEALEKGLPDCAGVALGLDRLLMILTHNNSINAVLNFPME